MNYGDPALRYTHSGLRLTDGGDLRLDLEELGIKGAEWCGIHVCFLFSLGDSVVKHWKYVGL